MKKSWIDYNYVMEAVKKNGSVLRHADIVYQDDFDIVMEAVKSDGYALKYASDRLKEDIDIVMEAVKNNGRALEFTSEYLQNDFDIVMEAVKDDGEALEFASEEQKNDFDIVLEAVRQNRYALEWASEELKNNREIVLEAVKNDAVDVWREMLLIMGEKLRNDREIVLEAAKRNGFELRFASEELRNDYDFVLEVVKNDGYALRFIPLELRSRELVMEAVKTAGCTLSNASEELQNDFDIVMEAVKNDGEALQYASKELQNDFDIVMEAVKNNGLALEFASEELINNFDIVAEAIRNNGLALRHASGELHENPEIVMEAIQNIKDKKEQANEIFWLYDQVKEKIIDKIEDKELRQLVVNSMMEATNIHVYAKDNYRQKYDEIELPSNMYMKFSFDSAGKYSEAMAYGMVALDTNANTDGVWEAGYNELRNYINIESPVIYIEEDNEAFTDEIYALCNKLTNLGQVTNRRCRAEIDIYTDYLVREEVKDNLNEIWGNAEEIIFKMCNEKGELPAKALKEYPGLIVDGGKATIDLSNSTINPNTWIDNITLYGRIIDASQKITDIEKKDNLTQEEKHMLDLRSKLTEEIPEEEKMEVLLDMLFVEEEKEVYRERYEETIKSIEQNPRSKRLFTREDVTISKEVNEFKDLAMQEKESDIDKIEKDFVDEKQKSLNQEVDIER